MELIFHLQSCDFDTEYARTALETNYTVRTKAEFFKNRDPCSQEIENGSKCL